MLDLTRVLDFYDKDPDIGKLKELDAQIRGMQRSNDFKVLLDEVERGKRLRRSDPDLLRSFKVLGLVERDLPTLMEKYKATIRRRMMHPSVQQGFYAA